LFLSGAARDRRAHSSVRHAVAEGALDRRVGAYHLFFTATPDRFAVRRRHRVASRPPLSAPNPPLEQGSPEDFRFQPKTRTKACVTFTKQPLPRHIHRDAMYLYIVCRYVASRSISDMIAANASYRSRRAFRRVGNRRRAAIRSERWPPPLFEGGWAGRDGAAWP
jgi:hypothetical protein